MNWLSINVGFLVSYDYDLLILSVSQVYDSSDKIVLSIDKNSKTWSGNDIIIPDSFYKSIKKIDLDNKILYHIDNFYVPTLSQMQCETRQRNLMNKFMGKGWKIQLDADEYVYDFKKFVKYLKSYWFLMIFPGITPVNFRGRWITLFRKTNLGYFVVDNNEKFPFATNASYYDFARNTFNIRNHFTNFIVIHQSWARDNSQIKFKLNNWGHTNDFDTQAYFKFWQGINDSNYQNIENFHPISPKVWNKLTLLRFKTVDELLNYYKESTPQQLIYINTNLVLKALFNKIYKRIRTSK